MSKKKSPAPGALSKLLKREGRVGETGSPAHSTGGPAHSDEIPICRSSNA